jgi:predicted RNA-binding protein with PIN domain
MKRSGNASHEDGSVRGACLIVDGYNVIARAAGRPLAKVENLEEARQNLLAALSEYAAYTGQQVIVVFDAHRAAGAGGVQEEAGVTVIFTMQHETADDRIERLVYELKDDYDNITVATSDAAEQQLAFGRGALRISADELVRHLTQMRDEVRQRIQEREVRGRSEIGDTVARDVAKILEKWRRQ